RLQVRILGAAFTDSAFNGNDKFRSQSLGGFLCRGMVFCVEHDLSDAFTIADVDKDEVAVVASPADPAHENNSFPLFGRGEDAATVRSLKILHEDRSLYIGSTGARIRRFRRLLRPSRFASLSPAFQ